MNKIGGIIKKKRLAMGLSRDKLARKTGITPKSIIAIENGSMPSTRTLFKVLDALDLEMRLEDKIRYLTSEEMDAIVDTIAETAMEGHKNVCFSIDDDIDVRVSFDAEVKLNQEDGYNNGTGAIIVEDASVKIKDMEVLSDIPIKMPYDKTDLGLRVTDRILEG